MSIEERLRSVFLILLAGALNGCVPAPYGSYYRPSYLDASAVVSRAYCGGQAGPPTSLAFAGRDGHRR